MSDTRYVTHDKWSSLTATEVTYPDGRQVSSTYDALYRRNEVNETSGGANIAAWQFFGNRTATVALGNGLTCSYMNNAQTNSAVQAGVPNPAWGDKTTDRLGYDGSGRLIAKRFLPDASTTSLVGFTTAYDPSSNKLFERALNAESRSALYPGYDSMDRLLQYQRGVLASGGGSITTPITLPGTDKQRSYDLDGLGNWKNTVFTPEGTSTATTEIRQHNKLNAITQFDGTPVLYDHGNNAGNPNPLIAQRGNGNIVDDGTRLYAYDALNRLVTVSRKSDSALVATYTYDALGRRALKVVTNGGVSGTIANATYRYIYDGQRIVEELLFAGGSYSTLRQFVWGQYIDELIQLTIPAATTTPPLTVGTYYPLQDTLYRTMALTNSSGAIVEAYDYDAYGNTLIYKGPGTDGIWFTDDDVATLLPACEFLFTGRQYDPETEIYWYRARYYHSQLGRFGGRDDLLNNNDLNSYELGGGNPVVRVDPSGNLFVKSFEFTATSQMQMLVVQAVGNGYSYSGWLPGDGGTGEYAKLQVDLAILMSRLKVGPGIIGSSFLGTNCTVEHQIRYKTYTAMPWYGIIYYNKNVFARNRIKFWFKGYGKATNGIYDLSMQTRVVCCGVVIFTNDWIQNVLVPTKMPSGAGLPDHSTDWEPDPADTGPGPGIAPGWPIFDQGTNNRNVG